MVAYDFFAWARIPGKVDGGQGVGAGRGQGRESRREGNQAGNPVIIAVVVFMSDPSLKAVTVPHFQR
jgi:hypothetical protein